jgi:opacity protein-like surface antigen
MHRIIPIIAVTSILFFATVDARGEVFVELYGGKAKTDNGKADISSNVGIGASGDVKYDSSFTVGGRVGGWIGKYFGIGVDIFHFDTDEKDSPVEQGNLAFALDLMARLPLLTSEAMPHGRLQPYATVGPAIFVSSLEMPGFTEARSTSIGFKGGAGLTFMFTKNIGLFGEYRYTYFKSEHELQIGPANAEISQRIGTHHFVGGVTIHFH